jgi:hypothetical protein
MEIVYFTLAAILLYLFSDWLVRRLEAAVGRRLKYRTLIFFAVLLTLSMSSFALIQALTAP